MKRRLFMAIYLYLSYVSMIFPWKNHGNSQRMAIRCWTLTGCSEYRWNGTCAGPRVHGRFQKKEGTWVKNMKIYENTCFDVF
jgi:hypothetical protein